MLMKQQRRKPMARGRDLSNKGFHSGNVNHHKPHHNNNNNNSSSKTHQKTAPPVITTLSEFPKPVTYGSYDYPLPSLCKKQPATRFINDLPSFTQRPGAIWKSAPLGSTFEETVQGAEDASRKQNDMGDPVMFIITQKKKSCKTFKLGSIEIDIYNKKSNAGFMLSGGNTKLVNKFLQKDVLGVTTPMKRNRDEIVEASSSMKKNRRMQELQADTTMELSFEGKAMDKSDLVKLIDSSGIMQDDTHLPDYETSQMNIDTRNLLQSTEFNFEYKRL